MNDPHADLTPAGAARRSEMRESLRGTFTAHHRRRRGRRRTAGAIAACLVVATAAQIALRPSTTTGPANPPTAPGSRIVIVDTTTADLERFSMSRTPPNRITIVDDETFLTELAAIDRPAGLIRMGTDVRLTRDVVDPRPDDA